MTLRDALAADVPAVRSVDAAATSGDAERAERIGAWAAAGVLRVAGQPGRLLGYCVTERSFFRQSFVELLVVVYGARRRGVGTALLLDAQRRRATPKLFTSTNRSNQPMRQLLVRLGWRPAGIVHGLDEDDPELILLAPSAGPVRR